jgi:diadenosine tetraphosphate (Ap4A) HIT family hydrolase
MSFHTDYESWQRMSDPRYCPVCQNEPMPSDMVDLVELPHSWLIAEPVECLRGACHVIAKKHAIELYDLDESELLGLMKEVQVYAWSLKMVTGAVKINYEIHGNTAPHMHMHLYPRYLGDPFPGQAIDYRKRTNQYPSGAFEDFVQQMQKTISESAKRFSVFR